MTRQQSHYQYLDCENEVLRSRYQSIKTNAADLVEKVEAYLKQGCSRTELYNAKEAMKKLLK